MPALPSLYGRIARLQNIWDPTEDTEDPVPTALLMRLGRPWLYGHWSPSPPKTMAPQLFRHRATEQTDMNPYSASSKTA